MWIKIPNYVTSFNRQAALPRGQLPEASQGYLSARLLRTFVGMCSVRFPDRVDVPLLLSHDLQILLLPNHVHGCTLRSSFCFSFLVLCSLFSIFSLFKSHFILIPFQYHLFYLSLSLSLSPLFYHFPSISFACCFV